MAVPAAIPVTVPLDEITVATLVLLLLHVPDAVTQDIVPVLPTHNSVTPDGKAGVGLTVTLTVAEEEQPGKGLVPVNVYVVVLVGVAIGEAHVEHDNPIEGLQV